MAKTSRFSVEWVGGGGSLHGTNVRWQHRIRCASVGLYRKCLRHFLHRKQCKIRLFSFNKNIISFTRVQCVLSYHVLYKNHGFMGSRHQGQAKRRPTLNFTVNYYTVWPRSFVRFYIASCHMEMDKTTWTEYLHYFLPFQFNNH